MIVIRLYILRKTPTGCLSNNVCVCTLASMSSIMPGIYQVPDLGAKMPSFCVLHIAQKPMSHFAIPVATTPTSMDKSLALDFRAEGHPVDCHLPASVIRFLLSMRPLHSLVRRPCLVYKARLSVSGYSDGHHLPSMSAAFLRSAHLLALCYVACLISALP